MFERLRCPDDASTLISQGRSLKCKSCKRSYPIHEENLIELMPTQFPRWNLGTGDFVDAEETYRKMCQQRFSTGINEMAWGDLRYASPGTRGFYRSQVKGILEILTPSPDATAIDVSGASGNHSRALATMVKAIANCDAHVPSIVVAHNLRPTNMLCIRACYLKLPFAANTFDCAICFDTLIRGKNHEVALLKEILRVLKVGGQAIVDFHNLKRFKSNRTIKEYDIISVQELLREASIKQYSIRPFAFVPSRLVPWTPLWPSLNGIFELILPCQRYVVHFFKSCE